MHTFNDVAKIYNRIPVDTVRLKRANSYIFLAIKTNIKIKKHARAGFIKPTDRYGAPCAGSDFGTDSCMLSTYYSSQ